jgi:hypothetical protein
LFTNKPLLATIFGAVNAFVPGLNISSEDDTLAALIVPVLTEVNIGKYEASVVVSLVILMPALIDAQVWSPRKYVVLLAVPVARRAVATVPELIFEALIELTAEPSPLNVAVIVPAANSPEAPRRTIVEAPLAEAAVVLALSIVPEAMLEALIAVSATPLPEIDTAVILPAPKPPDESLRTIVEAPLAVAAVVLALATVPEDRLEALILVNAEPSPLNAAEIMFAPKLPLLSRRTIVLALLDVLADVRALSMVPLEILEALIELIAEPLPVNKVDAVILAAFRVVKAPVLGVLAPIVTLLSEPPVIATALAS